MKNLKLIFLGLGCIAALSLTSCIDDNNDDNGLTKAQISQCLTAVVGNYSGKMIYAANNPADIADKQDTLDINWTITSDTIVTIKDFPAKAIAENIVNIDLKTALQEQNPKQDIKCLMAFVLNDPYIEFVLGPQKAEFPVFYKDQTHTLSVYFWTDYSYGDKALSSNLMVLHMTMGAVFLDTDEETNLASSTGAKTVAIPYIITTNL